MLVGGTPLESNPVPMLLPMLLPMLFQCSFGPLAAIECLYRMRISLEYAD